MAVSVPMLIMKLNSIPVHLLTYELKFSIRTRTIRSSLSARVSVPSLLHASQSPPPALPTWTWRTDLTATQPFWENWFVGLSSKFLEAKGGKLLLLAGTDRLDKELMIGQMQGKPFLSSDLSGCGYFLASNIAIRG